MANGAVRERADVVVIGGGPSGLVLASELALNGVRVVVLEKRVGLVQSRAGTILPRVLELLDSRGLAHTFIERARHIRPNPLFTTHMWAGMQPVQWHHLGSRFGFRLIMPQNITEDLLLTHARACGVDLRHGFTVTELGQDGDGVQVVGQGPDGPCAFDADWVVGADGGGSFTRTAVGIESDGHGPTFTGIVADVKFNFPWAGGRRITDNDHGWAASFPFSETEPVTRFNMVHAVRRTAMPSEPVSEQEVRACLRDIFEEEVPFEELRWASRFSDAKWLTRRWREGRVFLLGEASRVHYPASGVGMNFCIQDAFNLGWKLAAVVNGTAAPDLLDTYERERRPVAQALLDSVDSQVAVQFDFSPEGVAFKRMFQRALLPFPDVNARLARELNGLTFPYPQPAGSDPAVGWRVPDVDLVTETGEVRIGELLRENGFLLVDLTGNDAFADMKLAHLPVRVGSGVPVLTPPPLQGVTAILIRPDGYVAWTSRRDPSIEDARTALGQWLATDMRLAETAALERAN